MPCRAWDRNGRGFGWGWVKLGRGGAVGMVWVEATGRRV